MQETLLGRRAYLGSQDALIVEADRANRSLEMPTHMRDKVLIINIPVSCHTRRLGGLSSQSKRYRELGHDGTKGQAVYRDIPFPPVSFIPAVSRLGRQLSERKVEGAVCVIPV